MIEKVLKLSESLHFKLVIKKEHVDLRQANRVK